ncbi:MAG: septal ring lytic transglycosylase RlpA family protein [Candidatus Dadabacteria bacterium]|nr:septal ring lytic transglycosylase RlpA family protein [Candidatus Dadabacteria bacterium]
MKKQYLLLFALVFIWSCGVSQYIPRREPARPRPSDNTPTDPKLPGLGDLEGEVSGNVQVGLASWYGIEEHKRRAASGEVFDKDELTAAHKALPMDSIVRVTNLENGMDVIVRINDRGPFVAGRVIDLSYAAAKEVDLIGPGTAQVKVEVISTPHREDNYFKGKYVVQVGSFKDKSNAYKLKKKLSTNFDNVNVHKYSHNNDSYYRVRLVGYDTKSSAEREYKKLRKLGYKPRIKLE